MKILAILIIGYLIDGVITYYTYKSLYFRTLKNMDIIHFIILTPIVCIFIELDVPLKLSYVASITAIVVFVSVVLSYIQNKLIKED